jgi:hypothetical protein
VSSLFAGDGNPQTLSVTVDGGPTGIVFNGGKSFVVRENGVSAPARFLYACEDGTIRGWSPSSRMAGRRWPWSRSTRVQRERSSVGSRLRPSPTGHSVSTQPTSTTAESSYWTAAGQLPDRAGKPLTVNGLWGISFGNGGMAGPKAVLFFAAGPHRWLGATELAVHGLFGSISLADR